MITASNLTIGYDKPILSDISFTIENGEYICIIGENGAGKSTLIKTMVDLLPPLAGMLAHTGTIGFLPQQTVIQKDFPATVEEVVMSGFTTEGLFYNKTQKKYAARIMAQTGIDEIAKKSYRALSGGQQQRVLLTRALMASDETLILDEPVTGLSPKATKEMYALLKELQANRN